MKEDRHFELFTIDYDMLTYYRYHIVRQLLSMASGGYRRRKKLFMMEDELLAIKERADLIQIMKNQIPQSQDNVITI